MGQHCYTTSVFLRVPRKGDIITSGYITLAFLEAQDWAEYITCVFSGVPKKGDKIRSGYITPAFFEGPRLGGTGVGQTPVTKAVDGLTG